MISAIGETSDFREARWNRATDVQRDKFEMEMEQWRKDYPFAALIMSNAPHEKILKFAEAKYGK